MTKYLSHPPMRPPHKAVRWEKPTRGARFVDPRHGSDANAGTESLPYRTIAHALAQVHPGETILLRGGVYYENVYLAVVGRADARITIRSYPGEIATIDGGRCPELIESPDASWERVEGPVPDYFRTKRVYRKRYAFGRFADSMVGLLTYQHREDIEEQHRTEFENHAGEPFPAPLYIGPGLWYDDQSGHVYCRLSHTNYDFKTPGTGNYKGVTDPRKLPIVVSFYGDLPLFMDGAKHVVLQDLEIRGAGEDAVKLRGCYDVTFDNVTVYCGTYGMHARSSGPVKFLNSALYGSVPPWHVHAGQGLRVYSLKDKLANGKPPTRDIARLNTHVVLAIEGRTEEQVDYYIPGNNDWEIAYSDFTDSLDGAHLGGFGIRFHNNRLDRFQDDALYLTPLTPGVMGDVQVYNNLFTRCAFNIGFGGRSEPGPGPIYIYRNIIDARWEFLWTHYKPAAGVVFCTHFAGFPKLGEIHFYQNTVLTRINRKFSRASSSDWERTYAMGMLSNLDRGVPRRVFNNLFVYLEGMIPPSDESLGAAEGFDVRIDGNVHVDLVDPAHSAAKFEAFKKSELFTRTGWESKSVLGDPKFQHFSADQWSRNDYRIADASAARGAGVQLPAEYPDPMRATRPDAGALAHGASPFRAGREIDAVAQEIYAWLERSEPDVGATLASPSPTARQRDRATQASPLQEPTNLREHGWCMLRDFMPAQEAFLTRRACHGIGISCGVIAQSYNANLPTIPFYTRVTVINDTQQFAPYLFDPRILRLVHDTVGEKFCISETTMLIHEPGTIRGPWRAAKDELTTIWMFSPYTVQNGGHLVLPDGRRQPSPDRNDAAPRPSEGVATGKSGDMLVLSPGIWHAVAPNDDGDAPRICIVVKYARATGNAQDWPRDESSVLLDRQLQRIPESVRPLFQHWVQEIKK